MRRRYIHSCWKQENENAKTQKLVTTGLELITTPVCYSTGERVFLAFKSIFRALSALLGLNCPDQSHLGIHPLPGALFEVRHGGRVFPSYTVGRFVSFPVSGKDLGPMLQFQPLLLLPLAVSEAELLVSPCAAHRALDPGSWQLHAPLHLAEKPCFSCFLMRWVFSCTLKNTWKKILCYSTLIYRYQHFVNVRTEIVNKSGLKILLLWQTE